MPFFFLICPDPQITKFVVLSGFFILGPTINYHKFKKVIFRLYGQYYNRKSDCEILLTYLKRYGTARIISGRPSKSLFSSDSRVSEDISHDHLDHLVLYTQEKKKKVMHTRRLSISWTNV